MSKRRRFSDDFKTKVALGELRGDQTLSQIAARQNLHPNHISFYVSIKAKRLIFDARRVLSVFTSQLPEDQWGRGLF